MGSAVKCFLLILAAWDLVSDATRFRCDYIYHPHSRAWYKYHKIPATWSDARLMCTLEGGILASPKTAEIRDAMKKSLTEAGGLKIFTGFHSTFSKGGFYTVDGIPLEQINYTWAKDEPNNKNNKENCLVLNKNAMLHDVDCDEPRPYMCYRAFKAVKVNTCGTTDPEYNFDKRTGKCYKFHTVPRSFERAHFTCSAEGGHLAIINNQTEADVLRELFSKYPAEKMIGNFFKDEAYIGFSNWGEGGDWRTIHGQTLKEAGYDKFAKGQPNNATTGEYCGSINRTALLNDLWCQNSYAFICEKSRDYPAVCQIKLNHDTTTT